MNTNTYLIHRKGNRYYFGVVFYNTLMTIYTFKITSKRMALAGQSACHYRATCITVTGDDS